jgi:hypothetical protein
MTTIHASRLVLALIPILCLGAQCSLGDNEVGRVKDDGGPPPTDGFVADSASDSASDAHPAADTIPVSDDTAGPDPADSSPTSEPDASGSTCGQMSTSGPGTILGFQPVTTAGTTFHALVSEVADDHLVLQPDAGASVTFLWWGPPLSAEFTVGESVNCTQASDWSTVTSGKRSAEISFAYTNTSRQTSGTTPGGATYLYTPQCQSWETVACGSSSKVSSSTLTRTYYRIVVSQNGASVDIPMGTTAQLGNARVTNIFNNQEPSGFCGVVWDARNWEGLSVLRSIGP